MSKYFDSENLNEIIQAVNQVIQIRNDLLLKHGVDILENDTASLSTFVNIIKEIDPNYNCNFSRNGEDAKTMLNGVVTKIENKTTKLQKTKKGYKKASFAFHAEGLIEHDAYLFNIWDKYTLKPIKSYYVVDCENVKRINEKLVLLSNEWKNKPKTKAGYDVIYLHEDMLEKMIVSTSVINECKVHVL